VAERTISGQVRLLGLSPLAHRKHVDGFLWLNKSLVKLLSPRLLVAVNVQPASSDDAGHRLHRQPPRAPYCTRLTVTCQAVLAQHETDAICTNDRPSGQKTGSKMERTRGRSAYSDSTQLCDHIVFGWSLSSLPEGAMTNVPCGLCT
jgi:hypothetical protein